MANLINTIRGLYEKKDPNEYDNEGEMAKTQLRTMSDAAKELQNMLKDDENMPEWVQSKITKAVDYIDSVRDYMKSNANSVHTEEMVAKAERMIAELMESHFEKGDTVLWKGMKGTVLSSTGEGDDEVYTVKCEDGKTYKIPARQLEGGPNTVKEEVEVIDEDFEVTELKESRDDTQGMSDKERLDYHASNYKKSIVAANSAGNDNARKQHMDTAAQHSLAYNRLTKGGDVTKHNMNEEFEVTEEMIMEAFEQYMIDEGIWDSIKNFFGGKKSAPKADTGSEDNMDNDANTGGVKAGGSYKGVATYADKRDRSPIKTYKLPDSDKLKRQYDAQDKARAMAKDFTKSVSNIGDTVKSTVGKIADKIPQDVKDKYTSTFSTLGKELERRIRKPFSADKGAANPYSSQNFYKDKPEYQKIDQTGYKGISQQKRDLQTKSQLDKLGLKTEPLKQSYEPEVGMSLEESVRAVVLGEAKKISNDAIHVVLAKTKNSREGLAAIKKAFNVNDKEAKKLLDRVMNEEVELDEISKETLASYKKKAGEDARKADKEGDFARGNKRFSGIVKATKKEFDKANEEFELDEAAMVSTDALNKAVTAKFSPRVSAQVLGYLKPGTKKEVSVKDATAAMNRMNMSPRQIANVMSAMNEEVEINEAEDLRKDDRPFDNHPYGDKTGHMMSTGRNFRKKPGVKSLKKVFVGDTGTHVTVMGTDHDGNDHVFTKQKHSRSSHVDAHSDAATVAHHYGLKPATPGNKHTSYTKGGVNEEVEINEAPLVLRGRADANQTMLKMTQDYISKASDADLQKLGKLIGKKITVQGKKVIIEGVEIDLDEEINMSIKTIGEAKKYGLTQSLLDAVKGVLAADGDVDSKPLDPADPKQAKGKFADRKDKDINNDGKVDSTDKYLHNRRKAVTKAVEKEDDAEEVKGMKAKDSDDVKKGKGTKGAEAIEVNPNMKESLDDAVRRAVFGLTEEIDTKQKENSLQKYKDDHNLHLRDHNTSPSDFGSSAARKKFHEKKADLHQKAADEHSYLASVHNNNGNHRAEDKHNAHADHHENQAKKHREIANLIKESLDEASCKTMKEAEMTIDQVKKREKIVKSMKDKVDDFKKRYGDRAKDVMYATATKMAMKEGIELDEAKLDELGLGTLFSYGMKRLGQAMKGNLPPKKSPEVHAKNLERASDKLSDKKYVQTPTPKDNVVPFRKEDVDAMSENEINEAIKHDRYVNAHGKKASGEGNWMFTTAAPGRKSKETFSGKGKLGDVAKNAMKALGSKEVYVMEQTELDEISAETKASYKKKAGEEVKQLQPHAKKGEYKDLAKSLIAKRKKGMEKADK